MKKTVTLILIGILAQTAVFLSFCSGAEAQDKVLGGFEMAGFLSVGAGWQRFMHGTPTEWANDGSFAGVLGSVIPDVQTGVLPSEGEDNFMSFVEVAELDIMKNFGDKATLRGDIYFGRAASGSWVTAPGVDIEQAYLTAALSKSRKIEIILGRFGTQAGFEAYEPYNNDTISWSILTRANLYPIFLTGIGLSAELTDNITFYLAAANGIANDTTAKINDVPSGLATIEVNWGEEDAENSFVFTPYIAPESQSNRHISWGADATMSAFLTDKLSLGLEADFRRNDGNGGPDTNYAGGLFNLRMDFTETFYGVIKYSFVRQFENGNGVLNLTGTTQNIHEASIGGGYQIADGLKFKFEGRFDIVDPEAGASQYVPGAAIALACAF